MDGGVEVGGWIGMGVVLFHFFFYHANTHTHPHPPTHIFTTKNPPGHRLDKGAVHVLRQPRLLVLPLLLLLLGRHGGLADVLHHGALRPGVRLSCVMFFFVFWGGELGREGDRRTRHKKYMTDRQTDRQTDKRCIYLSTNTHLLGHVPLAMLSIQPSNFTHMGQLWHIKIDTPTNSRDIYMHK